MMMENVEERSELLKDYVSTVLEGLQSVANLLAIRKVAFLLQSETERGPERRCRVNLQGELISARKTSRKHNSRDLRCLR